MSSTVLQYLGQPCTKHHDVKVLPVPTYYYSVVVLCFIFVLFVVFLCQSETAKCNANKHNHIQLNII